MPYYCLPVKLYYSFNKIHFCSNKTRCYIRASLHKVQGVLMTKHPVEFQAEFSKTGCFRKTRSNSYFRGKTTWVLKSAPCTFSKKEAHSKFFSTCLKLSADNEVRSGRRPVPHPFWPVGYRIC